MVRESGRTERLGNLGRQKGQRIGEDRKVRESERTERLGKLGGPN